MKFTINDFMPTERKCAAVLKHIRWGKQVRCVDCNSAHVVSNGSYKKHYHKYVCRDCGRNFTELTGTIFEWTKIPIKDWVYIIREFQRNTSMNQISKELGRHFITVHRVINIVMNNVQARQIMEKLTGEVIEIDEMYHAVGQKGTKCESREARKRGLKLRGRGTWDKDKPPIVGIIERGGSVRLAVMKNATKKAVKRLLSDVTGKPIVCTDDFKIYKFLDDCYIHCSVNHSEREYAHCDVHTNTIEGLYSLLRHWLNTFRGVCKKNLQKFVSFFEFNYNNRDLNPLDKLHQLLTVGVPSVGLLR